jgi:uroporphyrinogen III methyltransferase/synthase
VYLVGAGPGDPKLLTLWAVELLGEADVIIYDRLIQLGVLSYARPGAELVYMGKPVGKHASRQDEILDLLVEYARAGKRVVRLKGGDPFVLGRGGEEAEHLAACDVPFEVVPGVSSAFAAPLSAGIPVTHRHAASCVTVVTGHECHDGGSSLDWDALARSQTLVFLMCVSTMDRIAGRLIAHGRPPETPAAVVQMAYWPGQQTLTATLATIAGQMRRAGMEAPATLVVGEVVRMHEKLGSNGRVSAPG